MDMYATTREFGGQRASISRRVIVKGAGGALLLGDVYKIDVERDEPVIAVHGSSHDFTGKLTYWNARSEADLTEMPRGTWCWPPRVDPLSRGAAQAQIGAGSHVYERLGKIGYAAYNEHQGGVNFEGKPVPTWDENKREDIKAAWDRASEVIADEVIATIEKQLTAGHTREAVINNARLYFGTRPKSAPAITYSGDSG